MPYLGNVCVNRRFAVNRLPTVGTKHGISLGIKLRTFCFRGRQPLTTTLWNQQWFCLKQCPCCNPHLSNSRPGGQMRSAKSFYTAHCLFLT